MVHREYFSFGYNYAHTCPGRSCNEADAYASMLIFIHLRKFMDFLPSTLESVDELVTGLQDVEISSGMLNGDRIDRARDIARALSGELCKTGLQPLHINVHRNGLISFAKIYAILEGENASTRQLFGGRHNKLTDAGQLPPCVGQVVGLFDLPQPGGQCPLPLWRSAMCRTVWRPHILPTRTRACTQRWPWVRLRSQKQLCSIKSAWEYAGVTLVGLGHEG